MYIEINGVTIESQTTDRIKVIAIEPTDVPDERRTTQRTLRTVKQHEQQRVHQQIDPITAL